MRYLYPALILLLFACGSEEFVPDFQLESVEGLKPIYADPDELTISLEAPKAIGTAGKIYSYGHLLIVNEVGQGFHILDNSDPQKPIGLQFVNIPGNNDVAIKNGIIYADSFRDLLALEVGADTVMVVKRIKDLIGTTGNYPPEHNVYFECVDHTQGVVVGWEWSTLEKPQCYRQ